MTNTVWIGTVLLRQLWNLGGLYVYLILCSCHHTHWSSIFQLFFFQWTAWSIEIIKMTVLDVTLPNHNRPQNSVRPFVGASFKTKHSIVLAVPVVGSYFFWYSSLLFSSKNYSFVYQHQQKWNRSLELCPSANPWLYQVILFFLETRIIFCFSVCWWHYLAPYPQQHPLLLAKK